MDRLSMLQKLTADKPADPFPRYGLAMEYRKQGRHEEALAAFESLTADHPDYVPTYLMYGNLLHELGRRDAAVTVYDRGIEVARKAGEDHAVSELRDARAELA